MNKKHLLPVVLAGALMVPGNVVHSASVELSGENPKDKSEVPAPVPLTIKTLRVNTLIGLTRAREMTSSYEKEITDKILTQKAILLSAINADNPTTRGILKIKYKLLPGGLSRLVHQAVSRNLLRLVIEYENGEKVIKSTVSLGSCMLVGYKNLPFKSIDVVPKDAAVGHLGGAVSKDVEVISSAEGAADNYLWLGMSPEKKRANLDAIFNSQGKFLSVTDNFSYELLLKDNYDQEYEFDIIVFASGEIIASIDKVEFYNGNNPHDLKLQIDNRMNGEKSSLELESLANNQIYYEKISAELSNLATNYGLTYKSSLNFNGHKEEYLLENSDMMIEGYIKIFDFGVIVELGKNVVAIPREEDIYTEVDLTSLFDKVFKDDNDN